LILKKSTDACEKDIFNITREHALIGHLASIHNIIRDIDFSIEEKRGSEHKLLWRELIDDLMETVTRGCTLANKVISDMNDDDEESTINVDCRGHVYFDNTEQQTVDYSRVHALTVNCWLTVKEACTLLGTISERVPMHKSTITKDVLGEECMITTTRLKHLGKLFMDMLLSTKHIGAIEKSQVGFQCLCKRLLICNIPELSVLPGQWLEDMIAIILKQETSILRRSAGVPFCIIALVKAEPQSMPRVLLPRVMKFLFELTSQENILKTDEESARKTVHALNILRAIFHEATLATHITQYIESGFTCSLNGFCSTNWTVRNSSLMCYTSLMQRALGKNVKVSSDHALTSREFFSRYPSLRPLLVSQLSIATKDHNSLHPSLYPSLLLLSRLRSMTDVSDDSSDEDMVPLVKQCVNNRHYMARTLAAKALVPLIEKTRYNDYVASIFEELDSCKSSNKRHGLLCQLYRFIKSEFNIEWLVKLVERLDQLTVKNQCHVSRTIYFKILSRMLRTAHANRDSIDSTLLSRVVDTTLPNSVFTKDTSNVGTALMQAQATTAVLQALHILNNQDLLAKTIVELISHDSYTARVALYEFMTKNNVEWIHDGEYQYVRKAILKSVLLEEMDVNVLTAGLTVIHTLLDRSFSNDFEHDRSLLWNRLLSFIKGANAYVKEQAIIVMGLLIRDDSMTKEWIDIMTEHVKPTQQDNLRLACQKSIKLSNMLKSDSGSAQLCAWKCCVILLQDEDEEIRKETASMLSYLISSSKYDLQVEYVLEACMNRMTELFHDNQEYIQFLLEFASLRDKQGQIQFQLEQIDQAPLFDPEPENIFVEALFTAQLAANQLYKISKNKPVNDTLLVEELQVVLDTVEKKNNVYHVGDLSNHTQIFLALYRVALGLRAVRSTNLKSMEDKLLHVLRSPNATLLNVFNELIPFEELMYTITQK
jgi:DNA gyrase inhibitor GyrI